MLALAIVEKAPPSTALWTLNDPDPLHDSAVCLFVADFTVRFVGACAKANTGANRTIEAMSQLPAGVFILMAKYARNDFEVDHTFRYNEM